MAKAGYGKTKGNAFERDISERLSLWVSYGARKDLFWRAAMSGGRATVSLRHGDLMRAQAGDITSVDPCSAFFTQRFFVECKFYKDLTFDHLIRGRAEGLLKFWNVAKVEAEKYKLDPFLVFKKNHWVSYVGVNSFGVELLRASCEDRSRFLISAIFPQLDLYVLEFDVFLTSVSPKKLKSFTL